MDARLTKTEVRVQRMLVRDGITEMLFGALLLVFGVLFSIGSPLAAFGALLPVALNPLGSWLKRRFVYPRIGYARAPKGERAIRGILITAIAAVALLAGTLGLFALALGFEEGRLLWLSHFVPAFAGLLMAIGPWTIARTTRLVRWYVMAGLFPLSGTLLPLLGMATGYAAISLEAAIIGGLALVYGLGLFVSFLRTYAVEEAGHGAGS